MAHAISLVGWLKRIHLLFVFTQLRAGTLDVNVVFAVQALHDEMTAKGIPLDVVSHCARLRPQSNLGVGQGVLQQPWLRLTSSET